MQRQDLELVFSQLLNSTRWKMFRTETHLHTAETSPCGRVSAVELIRQYYDAGYKTVFVSDHFYEKYFESNI